MKTSEIFTLAKVNLWNGKGNKANTERQQFICHAIEEIKDVPDFDKFKAKEIVQNLIFPCYTFEEWLEKKHNIRSWESIEKTQQTRKAWLNHLIKHYESIGD